MPTCIPASPLPETSPPGFRIPYGVADFIKLRRGHEYYVDKTRYLPLLEDGC